MRRLIKSFLFAVLLVIIFTPLENKELQIFVRSSAGGAILSLIVDSYYRRSKQEAQVVKEDIEEIKTVLRLHLKEDASLDKNDLWNIAQNKCGSVNELSDKPKVKQALKEVNLERQEVLRDSQKQALADRAIDEAIVEEEYDPNTSLSSEELSCIRSRMTNPDDDLIRQQIEKREIDTLDLS